MCMNIYLLICCSFSPLNLPLVHETDKSTHTNNYQRQPQKPLPTTDAQTTPNTRRQPLASKWCAITTLLPLRHRVVAKVRAFMMYTFT